jgi:RNA polymerase-binding transcription factor DksA
MLSKDQVRELKKALDDRFFELREEIRLELLKSDDESYIELAGRVHDIGEASVADLLVDIQLAEIDRHIQEIRDIDAALMRIASGAYGVCKDCSVSIIFKRLKAYPTAKRCHRCQVNHEHVYARVIGHTM